MPQFRYKAISATGEPLDGRMEAASAEDVIARLQDQGCLPIETGLPYTKSAASSVAA